MSSEDPDFPYLTEHQYFEFPAVETSNQYGITATGGNLSPGMMLSAYQQGIFPWYNAGEPLQWWCPEPRFVLFPKNVHTGKRFVRFLRKCPFTFTIDTCFKEVIQSCAAVPRHGQSKTWITPEMISAYCELFRLGYAHSIEAWHDGVLAGGLYGIAAGTVFCGESMFSIETDASRAAFTAFVYAFCEAGGTLIDSQVYTDYVASFGAKNVSRNVYLHELLAGMKYGYGGGKQLWSQIKSIFPNSAWWISNVKNSELLHS